VIRQSQVVNELRTLWIFFSGESESTLNHGFEQLLVTRYLFLDHGFNCHCSRRCVCDCSHLQNEIILIFLQIIIQSRTTVPLYYLFYYH
jgi:hypothetical protein